jgi:hypothetical protein
VDRWAGGRARLTLGGLPRLTSDSGPHYLGVILRGLGVWNQPQRRGTRGPHPTPRQGPPDDLPYATVHKPCKPGRGVSVTTGG